MRVVFWVCTALLLIATHYPKLQLGSPEDAPDKIVHFFVFGGWGVLLWAAGYVRNVVVLGVLVALFGLFDEWTQMIPWIRRTFDPGDLVADTAGGVCAAAWIYALGRTRVNNVREREDAQARAGWRLLASPLNLAHLVVAGMAGVFVGSIGLSVLVAVGVGDRVNLGTLSAAILGGFLGGWAVLLTAFFFGRRTKMPPESSAQQSEGRRRRVVLIAAATIAVWGGAMLTVGAALHFMAPSVEAWVFQTHARLGSNLGLAVDVAIVLIGVAWVTRRTRVRLARCE
jgi:VanZ family protein